MATYIYYTITIVIALCIFFLLWRKKVFSKKTFQRLVLIRRRNQIRTKKIEYYDDNHSIKFIYECVGQEKDGREELYYPSGKLNRIRNWNNGRLEGEMIIYYNTGNIYIQGNYENGKLSGDYTVYRENGKILTIKHY